jgi:hypothetical protein
MYEEFHETLDKQLSYHSSDMVDAAYGAAEDHHDFAYE